MFSRLGEESLPGYLQGGAQPGSAESGDLAGSPKLYVITGRTKLQFSPERSEPQQGLREEGSQ